MAGLMYRPLSALLVSTLILTGCSSVRESRINPFNWWGSAQSEPIDTQSPEAVNPLIPTRSGLFARRSKTEEKVYLGSPIETVTSLSIERTLGGAIVRATGVAQLQGIHTVQLTPVNDGDEPVDGVLTYRLEGIRATTPQVQGPEVTREVTAGHSLTDKQLAAARVIRVEGATNAMTTRR
jgi:hypothetical protein